MTTPAPAAETVRPPLAGWYVSEIHHLAKRALLWAVLYGLFARRSRGGCVGDDPLSPGGPVEACYQASMGPSPLVWLAMALVFVIAVGRAIRAVETGTVHRTLQRAAWAMPSIAILAFVIGIAHFMSLDEAALLSGSVPLGVTVEITTP